MLRRKIHVLILLLLGSALVGGCGKTLAPSPTPPPPSGVWEIAVFRDQHDFPPITTSHVWMDDEVAFMIVPNFKRAGGGGGSGSGGLPYKAWFHGGVYLPDGKTEVPFQAESVEGEIDSVTIANKSYDLRDGRLFFISSADGGFDVTQVDQDTRSLAPQPEDPAEIEALLRDIPEIEKFFPSARKQP